MPSKLKDRLFRKLVLIKYDKEDKKITVKYQTQQTELTLHPFEDSFVKIVAYIRAFPFSQKVLARIIALLKEAGDLN